MDIKCERCGTEYEIDEARLTEAGVQVKCTTCDHLFILHRPSGAAPASTGIQLRRDGQPLATCADIATAQRWVAERRLLRTDEFDLTGQWTRLGESPELAPFFALIDAAQQPPPAAPSFTAPLFATNPSIPMPGTTEPDLSARAVKAASESANAATTLQFRAPTNPGTGRDSGVTRQYQSASLTPPDAAATMQLYAPERLPVDDTAATELAMPALTLPGTKKPEPASTMQFRVPVAEPADATKTGTLPVPAGPMQPQGSLPENVDALETLQFKVPAGATFRDTLAGAPLMSAPPGDGRFVEGAQAPAATNGAGLRDSHPLPALAEPRLDTLVSRHTPKTPAASIPPVTDSDSVAPTIPPPTRSRPVSERAWATDSHAIDDDDPEIMAFKNRGKGARTAVFVVLVLAALAAVGWFVVKPRLMPVEVPAAAKAEFERGRTLARQNTVASLSEAEEAFRQALTLAGEAQPFVEAQAALAESLSARAELLIDSAAKKAKRGDAEAAKAVNEARTDAKAALEQAFTAARAAYEAQPEAVAGRRALVDYYRVAGSPDKAADLVKPVEAAASTDPESKAFVAALWAAQDQHAAAQAALREVIDARPELARAQYWLAQSMSVEGQDVESDDEPVAARAPRKEAPPKKTVAPKKKAPAPEPKAKAKPVMAPAPQGGLFDDLPPPPPPDPARVDVDELLAQGNQWLRRGQPDKAVDYFDQAVRQRPSHAEAVFLRGVARFDLGRTDEAIVDLQRALKLSPRFADAMIVLAGAWKVKGNVAEARAWYQKYLDVMPDGKDAAAARANLARLK